MESQGIHFNEISVNHLLISNDGTLKILYNFENLCSLTEIKQNLAEIFLYMITGSEDYVDDFTNYDEDIIKKTKIKEFYDCLKNPNTSLSDLFYNEFFL